MKPSTDELELLQIALQNREAGAYERADALREKYGRRAGQHIRRARLFQRAEAHQAAIAAAQEADRWLNMLEEIDRLLKDHGGWVPVDRGGPTAELLMQIKNSKAGDPVLRMVAKGHLTYSDLRVAREIAGIIRHETVRLDARTTRFPTVDIVDEEPAAAPAESAEWYALLHSFVYKPWATEIGSDLALVLGLVVDGEAIEQLRKKHGLRWNTALRRVISALSAYRKIRGRYLRANERRAPESAPAGATSSPQRPGSASASPTATPCAGPARSTLPASRPAS